MIFLEKFSWRMEERPTFYVILQDQGLSTITFCILQVKNLMFVVGVNEKSSRG